MDFLRPEQASAVSPPVLAFPTNSCPVITRRSVTQVPAPPPMSRGAILWGGENLLRPEAGHQMFSCWLEEALLRGIIRPPRARFDFIRRDQPGHGQVDGAEEWPLTGSRKSKGISDAH